MKPRAARGPVRRRRPLAVLCGAAAAALLLSSCGSGAPGVAAQVGTQRITDSEVDDFAQVLCALNAQPGQDSATPTGPVRRNALQILLGDAIAADMADLDAVSPQDVRTAVTQADATRELVPERLRDTFDDKVVEYAIAQYAIIDLGRRSLAGKGQDPARITDDDAYAEGDRLRHEYAARKGVAVDPRFGRMVDGALQASDGSLSVPVSDFAVAAAKGDGGATILSQLPASQKCG